VAERGPLAAELHFQPRPPGGALGLVLARGAPTQPLPQEVTLGPGDKELKDVVSILKDSIIYLVAWTKKDPPWGVRASAGTGLTGCA